MIIRESRDHFTMITQHDHSALSGEIAKYFQPSLFDFSSYSALHDTAMCGICST